MRLMYFTHYRSFKFIQMDCSQILKQVQGLGQHVFVLILLFGRAGNYQFWQWNLSNMECCTKPSVSNWNIEKAKTVILLDCKAAIWALAKDVNSTLMQNINVYHSAPGGRKKNTFPIDSFSFRLKLTFNYTLKSILKRRIQFHFNEYLQG